MVIVLQVPRFVICLLPLCSIALTDVSATVAQSQPREVHLAVRIQGANGDSVSDLSAKDFAVTVRGARIPVTVSRPAWNQSHGAVPTRLLVVIATSGGLTSATRTDLLNNVRPFWKKGWQVSVLGETQTPYTTSDVDLRRALDQPSRRITLHEAISDLGQFTGQKMIFCLTDPGHRLDGPLRAEAWNIQAMIYHVPGNPWDNYGLAFTGVTTQPLQNDQAGADISISVPTVPGYSLIISNLREERSFGSARTDAFYDAMGYYDLRFVLPADAPLVSLAITKGTSYRVTAEAYVEDRTTPPELQIAQAQ